MQVIFANAANCQSAARIITERYPHITATPCTAHTLDLLMEDVCKIPEIAEYCSKGKALVLYVVNHQMTLSTFRCVAFIPLPWHSH